MNKYLDITHALAHSNLRFFMVSWFDPFGKFYHTSCWKTHVITYFINISLNNYYGILGLRVKLYAL